MALSNRGWCGSPTAGLSPALGAFLVDMRIAAGAAEVVPETFESSLMLASHALVLLGVRLKRVVRMVSPEPETRLQDGSVVVLLGTPEQLAAAEMRLLQGTK